MAWSYSSVLHFTFLKENYLGKSLPFEDFNLFHVINEVT